MYAITYTLFDVTPPLRFAFQMSYFSSFSILMGVKPTRYSHCPFRQQHQRPIKYREAALLATDFVNHELNLVHLRWQCGAY